MSSFSGSMTVRKKPSDGNDGKGILQQQTYYKLAANGVTLTAPNVPTSTTSDQVDIFLNRPTFRQFGSWAKEPMNMTTEQPNRWSFMITIYTDYSVVTTTPSITGTRFVKISADDIDTGTLSASVGITAVQGSIGGWTIEPYGIYKTLEEEPEGGYLSIPQKPDPEVEAQKKVYKYKWESAAILSGNSDEFSLSEISLSMGRKNIYNQLYNDYTCGIDFTGFTVINRNVFRQVYFTSDGGGHVGFQSIVWDKYGQTWFNTLTSPPGYVEDIYVRDIGGYLRHIPLKKLAASLKEVTTIGDKDKIVFEDATGTLKKISLSNFLFSITNNGNDYYGSNNNHSALTPEETIKYAVSSRVVGGVVSNEKNDEPLGVIVRCDSSSCLIVSMANTMNDTGDKLINWNEYVNSYQKCEKGDMYWRIPTIDELTLIMGNIESINSGLNRKGDLIDGNNKYWAAGSNMNKSGFGFYVDGNGEGENTISEKIYGRFVATVKL